MDLDWSTELVTPITFPLILVAVQYLMYRGKPSLRLQFLKQYVWAGVIGGGAWAIFQSFWYYRRTQSFTWVFIVGGLVWFAVTVVVGWLLLKSAGPRSNRRAQRRNEPWRRE